MSLRRMAIGCAAVASWGCRDAPTAPAFVDASPSQPAVSAQGSAVASPPAEATPLVPSATARPRAQRKVLDEHFEALGPHYRLRRFSVESKGFESIAHYESLLFGDTVLAEPVDFRALSPDERYIVYSDGHGHNFVHGAESGQARPATPSPYALPESVRWDVAHKQVTLTFGKSAPPMSVALP